MLSENKIKLMTKMSMYKETPEGKEAVNASKFFAHDYVTRNIIWTEIGATIAYALALFIIAVLKMDTLVADIASLNIKTLAILILCIYIVVLIVFFIFAYKFYSKKYVKLRGQVVEYNENLKKLNRHYKIEAENAASEDVYTVE